MYLLDTNVISELRRNRPHGAVLAWVGGVEDRELHISAVSVGEIQAGIELTRDRDPAKAAEIEGWLEQVAASWNVLPMDARTFRRWAQLAHRRPQQLMEDAMIAATAAVHDLTLVTRNTRDFTEMGVRLLNPFEPQT